MPFPVTIGHANPGNEKITVINWCLGNTCNFACSYCPEALHAGSVPWIDYDAAIDFSQRIITHYDQLGQQIEFLFTGGEPTMYPRFLKLLYYLKEAGCRIGVISNGSRTMEWWQKAKDALDFAFLTYHIEYSNRDKFIAITELLGAQMPVHVNLTVIPARFDECLAHANIIYETCTSLSLSLKPLLKNMGDHLYDYTAEQQDILTRRGFKPKTLNRYASRGMMKVLYDDDTAVEERPAGFILKDSNHWQGWYCNAGIELVYIDFNGDIYRGTCRQGGKLGNVLLQDVNFPSAPVLCSKKTCHCLSDIMLTKNKPLRS